jgi:hypothetical protein
MHYLDYWPVFHNYRGTATNLQDTVTATHAATSGNVLRRMHVSVCPIPVAHLLVGAHRLQRFLGLPITRSVIRICQIRRRVTWITHNLYWWAVAGRWGLVQDCTREILWVRIGCSGCGGCSQVSLGREIDCAAFGCLAVDNVIPRQIR